MNIYDEIFPTSPCLHAYTVPSTWYLHCSRRER